MADSENASRGVQVMATASCIIDESVLNEISGALSEGETVEMVMPGDSISMKIELISPIAIEKGMRVAIREGGRTVGSGLVTQIIE